MDNKRPSKELKQIAQVDRSGRDLFKVIAESILRAGIKAIPFAQRGHEGFQRLCRWMMLIAFVISWSFSAVRAGYGWLLRAIKSENERLVKFFSECFGELFWEKFEP